MKQVLGVLVAIGLLGLGAGAADAGGDPRLPLAAVRCGEGGSGRSLVVLPAADGVVPEAAIVPLEDAATEADLPIGKVKKQLTGSSHAHGWCVAEKTVKVGKKVVAVTVSGVGEWTGLGSDSLEDMVTVVARPFTNKAAAALIKSGKLKRPLAIAGDPDDELIAQLRAGLADRTKAAALWSTSEEVILAGSAPGELYQGAKARQTFAAWNLGLRVDGPVTWSTFSRGQLAWALANVEATPAKGGAATTYRAFFVLLADHAEQYIDGDEPPEHDTWRLVLAHFALVE